MLGLKLPLVNSSRLIFNHSGILQCFPIIKSLSKHRSSFNTASVLSFGAGAAAAQPVRYPFQDRRCFITTLRSFASWLAPSTAAASSANSASDEPNRFKRKSPFRSGLLTHPGFAVVPHQSAFVIERLGKFYQVLTPGFHFLLPFIDKVAYVHSLKEEAINVANQSAITRDNVLIQLDGVLYIKVENPYDASYGVESATYSITQLAQTTMRSELGKLTLDETFLEREVLNQAITTALNAAASSWGIRCMRYEIRDIVVPVNIRNAMERQAEAERRKRAEILQSEGERESAINLSLGRKQAVILQAQGEAEAVVRRAEATAKGLKLISESIALSGGKNAVAMQLAEQYMEAFGRIAKEGNTIIIPANPNDASGIISQALAVFNNVKKTVDGTMGSSMQLKSVSQEEPR